jgi:hypothetical protein
METFTKEKMKQLAAVSGDACVSIYMPTQQKTTDFRKDQIRFKNLLRDAEKSVSGRVENTKIATTMLEPAQKLMNDMVFWQHQGHGLALFLTPNEFFMYQLPLRFDEQVVCAGRFHLKPLLPFFSNNGRFYILALSQNEIRLFDCTRHDVLELELGLPGKGLDETLDYDTKRRQLQFHTGSANGAGPRPAVFHGHGVGKDDNKDEIFRYFRAVDSDLNEVLREENLPLVLAGVEYLLPLFRSASSYRHIVEKGITGNPEELSGKELHEMAWDIVERYFRENQRAALKRYREMAGTGLASADFDTVLKAACYGRVDTLFVALGVQHWGIFNRDIDEIKAYENAAPGAEDLLDLAAVETFKNNGVVFALESTEVPENKMLAAVMRY